MRTTHALATQRHAPPGGSTLTQHLLTTQGTIGKKRITSPFEYSRPESVRNTTAVVEVFEESW
jgi:hypothetical protein